LKLSQLYSTSPLLDDRGKPEKHGRYGEHTEDCQQDKRVGE